MKLQHDAERAAKKASMPVNQQQIDQLKEELALAERLKSISTLQKDIRFDRATALLSPEDAQIAERLRGLFGEDIPAALNSTYAADIRLNNALSQTRSDIDQAITGIGSSLTSGLADILDGTKSAKEGFADLAKGVVRSLEEMLIKILVVEPAVRGLQTALNGSGLLSSLFGFGGGATGAGGTAGVLPALYAAGGYTGDIDRNRIAGVVHGKEYVFDALSTARIGVGVRGYADGGFVGAPPAFIPPPPPHGARKASSSDEGPQVVVHYSVVNNVQGSGPELDRLRAEIARDRAEAPARIVKTVREARSRRAL